MLIIDVIVTVTNFEKDEFHLFVYLLHDIHIKLLNTFQKFRKWKHKRENRCFKVVHKVRMFFTNVRYNIYTCNIDAFVSRIMQQSIYDHELIWCAREFCGNHQHLWLWLWSQQLNNMLRLCKSINKEKNIHIHYNKNIYTIFMKEGKKCYEHVYYGISYA